jgi:hypothetical protein
MFTNTPLWHVHNTVVKADSLVADDLRQGLKAAFETLRAEQGDEPDWHPKSGDLVQDLVHPSLYPFVYGTSACLVIIRLPALPQLTRWG